jgi:putative PIN family toxin of toxin-antitoxin system
MKVLLDTNVLASAIATRGLCADVLREVLAEHQLVVSSQIFSELRRVLRDKFGTSGKVIDGFVRMLQQDTIIAKVGDLPTLNLRDKDDLGILAAAESGDANVIVTGDKELQDLGDFKGVAILSPRQFWQQLTTQ